MAQSQDELCDRCRDLDLESYAELRTKRGRGTIAFIEKASLRRSCLLCNDFGHVFTEFKTPRARVSNHDSFALDFRQVQFHETTLVYFRIRFMEFTGVLDFDFYFYPTAACIPDLTSQRKLVPLSRPMKTESSDLDLAKEWLRTCQTSHAECASSKTWKDSLRVLDCKQQRTTSINSSEPYACLSYVWGDHQAGMEPSKSAEGLQHMPQTITNAMSVCIALGIQYLWVDRYCIDQTNPIEKHHIISNMDEIYQGAHLTIVASAGENPSHGLPGVQSTPRRRQLYLKAGQHIFASTEDVREQIRTSTWNSRGWTYQEMLLSRRRLVFTDSQMYFQCQFTHYLESLNMGATARDAFLSDRYRVFPPLDVTSLQSRISEYYQRHLSVRSDVINAFSGVCNHALAQKSTSLMSATFSHFYGIPIYRARSNDIVRLGPFLSDLAWRAMHRNPMAESPEFLHVIPTWSWASPKAHHQSNRFSGEYWQPPKVSASQSFLKPRCMTKSGRIVDMKDILKQGTDHSNFYPQLILEGFLLDGAFSPVQTDPGSAYFDSQEPLDPHTVVAMYLGVDETTLGHIYDVDDHAVVHSGTHRVISLLLQHLTPEQRSPLRGNPHFDGSDYYRRVGLWIRDTPNHAPEAPFSPEVFMQETCEHLNTNNARTVWTWRRQTLTLV